MHIPDLRTTTQRFISPLALADYLCISRRTVYLHIETGKIDAVKVGGQWRIPIQSARVFAGLIDPPDPVHYPSARPQAATALR
jgi:excisionase family DNA binding protein